MTEDTKFQVARARRLLAREPGNEGARAMVELADELAAARGLLYEAWERWLPVPEEAK